MVLTAGILAGLFFLVMLLMLASLLKPSAKPATLASFPFISILVAARNEEKNIGRCIEALKTLGYPSRLEVLIGDDNSEDNTIAVAVEAIKNDNRFRVIPVKENLGKARGKANVLAHLAREAQGDIYLVTDADIAVNPGWATTLVSLFEDETGIVSGTTVVTGERFFDRQQGIDWLYYMGLMQCFDRLGMHCTAVGNNMAVKKEAYLATGGFENLSFSIVEDYRLFQAVTKAGWRSLSTDLPRSLAFSKPAPDLKRLFHQRKRWIKGAEDLPFYWQLILFITALFYPALVVLAITTPLKAAMLWLVKIFLQSLLVKLFNRRAGNPLKPGIAEIILYEFYGIFTTYISALFYLLPVKFDWKGRKYM